MYCEVKIDATQALRELDAIGARLSNMRGGLQLVGAEAVTMVQRHFDTQVDEAGSRWPPNAAITIALKGSSKPLTDTARLRGAVYAMPPAANYVDVTIKDGKASARQSNPGGEITLKKLAEIQNEGATIRAKNKRFMARELSRGKLGKALKVAQEQKLGGIRIIHNKKTGKDHAFFGKQVTIPRRQFFYLNLAEREKLTGILGNWAMGGRSAEYPMSNYGVPL